MSAYEQMMDIAKSTNNEYINARDNMDRSEDDMARTRCSMAFYKLDGQIEMISKMFDKTKWEILMEVRYE